MPDKVTIRKEILEKRAALNPAIVEMVGKTAAEKLVLMEEYNRAGTVMAYMDFRNEVPTGSIIEQIRGSGRKLVLPLTDKDFHIIPYEIPLTGKLEDYMVVSPYGIPEPNPALCKVADSNAIDLVIVPGSVFDQYENRIGYGKGCYDRFLASIPSETFKLALAYAFQVLPCIPAGPADVKMDKILTLSTVL